MEKIDDYRNKNNFESINYEIKNNSRNYVKNLGEVSYKKLIKCKVNVLLLLIHLFMRAGVQLMRGKIIKQAYILIKYSDT